MRLIACEANRSRYDHAKSARELACTFRSTVETLAGIVARYRATCHLPANSTTLEHNVL
jgi:hypothetical protein